SDVCSADLPMPAQRPGISEKRRAFFELRLQETRASDVPRVGHHEASAPVQLEKSAPLLGNSGSLCGHRLCSGPQRTTITGTLLWVSTLKVSPPISIAARPLRPWDAMHMASQRCFSAAMMISCHTCSP